MKNLFKTTILFFFLSGLLSCSNDFDVIAPYKEVIVVNGLLDALDSVHYVHVSKAFLGEGNVYNMAQQQDSINYADILDVTLERWYAGTFRESFPMTRTTEIDKDSGAFSSPYQVLYKTAQNIRQDGSEYRIVVNNRETGMLVSSRTKIVKDVFISPAILPEVDLITPFESPIYVTFYPGDNTAQVDMIVRFHYREIDPSGVSAEKSFDYNFSDKTYEGGEVKYAYYRYNFFQLLSNKIPILPGYTRRVDSLSGGKLPFEYILIAGSEDLQTYIELNSPSTGIVQDKPLFTTVENGLGLFTSRLVRHEYRNLKANSRAGFDTLSYTRDLNFQF